MMNATGCFCLRVNKNLTHLRLGAFCDKNPLDGYMVLYEWNSKTSGSIPVPESMRET